MNSCKIGIALLDVSFITGIIFIVSVCILFITFLKRKNNKKVIITTVIAFIVTFLFSGVGNYLSHDWEIKNTVEASCTEEGIVYFECKKCSETKDEKITELGHKWATTNREEPSCVKDGFADYICERCSVEKTDILEKIGHDWSNATCTTPKLCKRCDIKEGEVLGHEWKKATCEIPEKCSKCGKTKGKALGHSYFEKYYDLILSCMTCGDVYVYESEDFLKVDKSTKKSCEEVIVSKFEEHGFKNVNVTMIGYEEYPDTFYYYTISCTNMSDFKPIEIYDALKDNLDYFPYDYAHYRLINITCNNDIYILDDSHEKLIKNGEYCYDPYNDTDRPKISETPYVGMDVDDLKKTELGPYDDCKIFGENNPRPLFVYVWEYAGERYFEASVIQGEVIEISYLEDGRWVTDYGDRKVN